MSTLDTNPIEPQSSTETTEPVKPAEVVQLVLPPPRNSRGPQTPEGRARCSMNALKHGKYAKLAAVLNSEDPVAYREYIDSYIKRYQPTDPPEHQLVAEVAAIDWRLNRVLAVETRSIDLQLRLQNNASEFERYQLSQLAAAMRKLTDDSAILDSLTRQQQTLIRNRQIILETLFRIREKQPTQERSPILNPDNYIDPETESKTVSNGRENGSGTVSNGLRPETAR